MQISELMIGELAREMEMTRRLLSRIPDDKLTWEPGSGLHTIGWNANHLVETIGWVPGIISASEFDIAPVGEAPPVAEELSQTSQLLKAFDIHSASALSALKGVSDQVMDEPWSLMMGGQILFTMKKGDCLRKWVFTHSAHHRGILSVYLRMAGVKFPSLYEE